MTNKMQLYQLGVAAASDFLAHNKIPSPIFLTYEEAFAALKKDTYAFRLLARVVSGPLLGTNTGLYSDGYVFVNVPVTAAPVQHPAVRSWSWPGWKTDRTAVGVVAHEVGHYVEHWMQMHHKMTPVEHGPAWRSVIRGKRVSGYEPVPSEAWAESMRLFILNPDLLRKALPARYQFIYNLGLRPVPRLLRKGYAGVLQNPAYVEAANRFIGV